MRLILMGALQTGAAQSSQPTELLECCCLIPVPSREFGGAGSCSAPSCFALSANPAQPRFGGFWHCGATRSCPADSQLYPRMDFSQMLRKGCSLSCWRIRNDAPQARDLLLSALSPKDGALHSPQGHGNSCRSSGNKPALLQGEGAKKPQIQH